VCVSAHVPFLTHLCHGRNRGCDWIAGRGGRRTARTASSVGKCPLQCSAQGPFGKALIAPRHPLHAAHYAWATCRSDPRFLGAENAVVADDGRSAQVIPSGGRSWIRRCFRHKLFGSRSRWDWSQKSVITRPRGPPRKRTTEPRSSLTTRNVLFHSHAKRPRPCCTLCIRKTLGTHQEHTSAPSISICWVPRGPPRKRTTEPRSSLTTRNVLFHSHAKRPRRPRSQPSLAGGTRAQSQRQCHHIYLLS